MTETAVEKDGGIESVVVLVETPLVRIARLALAPGGSVPWHWHSRVAERFLCLEGAIEIECRAPPSRQRLSAGEEGTVGPKTAHTVRNAGSGHAHFAVIQSGGGYDLHMVGQP